MLTWAEGKGPGILFPTELDFQDTWRLGAQGDVGQESEGKS